MIERDLGIDGLAVMVERQLEVACALVHALMAQPASDLPAEQAEVLALFEDLTLSAAVFGTGAAPRLANGAWRALLGARGTFPSEHLGEVLRTGTPLHLAELMLDLGDRSAPCAATLRPIRDRGGAVTGVIVLCTLLADEVIARDLAVSADALVWGGSVLAESPDYYNGAWGGYTRDARRFAQLYAWKDAIHADDRASYARALGEVTQRGEPAEIEARVRRADGEYRWHRIRFVIAPGARWYAVATDIERARAEAERAELVAREALARAEAERAHRLKDQFIAAAAHELRAPLAALARWELVLRDEAAGIEARAQALDAIRASVRSQERLIGELLEASHAVGGGLQVDLRPLDLEGVLRGALEAAAPAALAGQLALERRGARLSLEVRADAARLRQVLDTLLANAVKFTGPGGQITVSVALEERAVAIGVEDSGCGIAPDFLPRVFEPFSRLHHDPTASGATAGAGLGLGLAIAHQIVALHHGELTVASAGLGRGATFTLRLPIADERRARRLPGASARP